MRSTTVDPFFSGKHLNILMWSWNDREGRWKLIFHEANFSFILQNSNKMFPRKRRRPMNFKWQNSRNFPWHFQERKRINFPSFSSCGSQIFTFFISSDEIAIQQILDNKLNIKINKSIVESFLGPMFWVSSSNFQCFYWFLIKNLFSIELTIGKLFCRLK